MRKYICRVCDWHDTEDKVLRATNPFDDEGIEEMLGCPECREANTLRLACDEVSCWREVSCGTPTPDGYRQTCSEHWPNK